jgi:hypothetical protein
MHEISAVLYFNRVESPVSLEYTRSVEQQCMGLRWRKQGIIFFVLQAKLPSSPPTSQHPMQSHPSHNTALPPVENIMALSYRFSKLVWINDRASTKKNSCISVSHIQLERSPACPVRGVAFHSLLRYKEQILLHVLTAAEPVK